MSKELSELRMSPQVKDTIEIYLDPNKHPETYQRKKLALIKDIEMSESEAERYLLNNPFKLELFYDFDTGMFALEAEIIDCDKTYNPFTGSPIPKEDPECCGEISFEKLKEMWDEFGDTPIDKNECIETGFRIWPIGTDRFLIWEWFDERCPNNLHDDLMFPK